MAENILELRDIKKSYSFPESSLKLDVLKGLCLNIKNGEPISIAGPSGSGKSTLLNIIGLLDFPDSGDIIYNGKKITGYSDKQMAEFRNKEIGFVFQEHHLLPQLTVIENVLLPVLPQKPDKELQKLRFDKAMYLLGKVNLQDRNRHKPGQLSVGERQRAAVVRALINGPKILLADEPTGSLDRKNSLKLAELLVELNESENIALIVVTHSDEVAGYMKKKFVLRDGKLM